LSEKAIKVEPAGFSTVTRMSPTEQVRDQLMAAIQSGEYQPGGPLPSERQLCEVFGVSRVCVREALAGLAAIGMISIQQGRGAFVRAGVGEEFAPFGAYVEMHREELIDLLKIRGALDGLAAEGAAKRVTDDVLQAIQSSHQAFVNAVNEGASAENLIPLDVAFHLSIAEAAGGQFLPRLLKELNGVFEESRLIMFNRQGQPPRSAKQHQAIVDAILAHDAPAANFAAATHVQGTVDWLTSFSATPSTP